MPTQINSIENLKERAEKSGCECFIQLNGCRSSKHISYDKDSGKFWVCHYIDGSDEYLTEKEIMDSAISNIGNAMNKGALFADGD